MSGGEPAAAGSPWLEDGYTPGPGLDAPLEVEVAIVGAGLTGLSTACALAGRVARVAVLERGRIGGGSTGRSAGVLMTGTGDHHSRLAAILGPAEASAIVEASREGLASLRRRIDASGRSALECGVAGTGSYRFALSPRERLEMERTAPTLQALGVRLEVLDRERTVTLTGSRLFQGAFHFPDDLVVDPVKLVMMLAADARSRGVVIHESTPVQGLEEAPDASMRLVTPGGNVKAQMVVLASGAQTLELVPELSDRVVPVRAQGLLTATVPSGTSLPAGSTNFGNELWRMTPDGRVLACGAREASEKTEWIMDDSVGGKVQAALEKFLAVAFPVLAPVPVERRWAGINAVACDEIPIIGSFPGRAQVVAALGLGHLGLSLAAAAGTMMADQILTGRFEHQEIFGPRRFT